MNRVAIRYASPFKEGACGIAAHLVFAHALRRDLEAARSVSARARELAISRKAAGPEASRAAMEAMVSRMEGDLAKAGDRLEAAENAFAAFRADDLKWSPIGEPFPLILKYERGLQLLAAGRTEEARGALKRAAAEAREARLPGLAALAERTAP